LAQEIFKIYLMGSGSISKFNFPCLGIIRTKVYGRNWK